MSETVSGQGDTIKNKQTRHIIRKLIFSNSNTLYNTLLGEGSIHHARIRMGLSGLNAQRKKYHFVTYNHCPLCGTRPEDSIHFLLRCPNLAIARNVLIGAISPIVVSKLPSLDLNPTSKSSYQKLNDLLLHGSDLLNRNENITIFNLVQQFITETKRFDIN